MNPEADVFATRWSGVMLTGRFIDRQNSALRIAGWLNRVHACVNAVFPPMNATLNQTEDLVVGNIEKRGGFFTKLHLLGNVRDWHELERRIGYKPGRLKLGWYVLLLKERAPAAHEFDFAGYSYFSGGRERGHDPNPQKRGRTMDEELKAMNVDVAVLKRKAVENFWVSGPERIVKIVPREKDLSGSHEEAIQRGNYWNPQLDPISQWILTARLPFLVYGFYTESAATFLPKQIGLA